MIPIMWAMWENQRVQLLDWDLLIMTDPFEHEEAAIIKLPDESIMMVPVDELSPLEME